MYLWLLLYMTCVPRDLSPAQVLGQSKSISFVCGMQRFVSARERESPLGDLILRASIGLIEFSPQNLILKKTGII